MTVAPKHTGEAGAPAPQPASQLSPGRPAGLGEREKWGYIFWGLAAITIMVPEVWALLSTPPWPTISAVVGYLETRWSWVAIIVVALIAAVATEVVTYPWWQTGRFGGRADGRRRGRTASGRLTKDPDSVGEVSTVLYFVVAVVVVAAGSAIAAAAGASAWVLGSVLYGLLAVFFIVIPSVLAFWFARDVPFPTFFRTISDLEHRWHAAAVVIVAALAVLLLHLAFFPWPDIFRHATTGAP